LKTNEAVLLCDGGSSTDHTLLSQLEATDERRTSLSSGLGHTFRPLCLSRHRALARDRRSGHKNLRATIGFRTLGRMH